MYYILMELSFQDNEGIFNRDDSNDGIPKLVFTSKKKAEEVALQKNLSEFENVVRKSSIRIYASRIDEIIFSKTLEDDLLFEEGIFMTIFGQTAEDWWRSLRNLRHGEKVSLKIEPSSEQWKKLYDCFTLRFWSVLAVDKG